jgi:hypothetical protein
MPLHTSELVLYIVESGFALVEQALHIAEMTLYIHQSLL